MTHEEKKAHIGLLFKDLQEAYEEKRFYIQRIMREGGLDSISSKLYLLQLDQRIQYCNFALSLGSNPEAIPLYTFRDYADAIAPFDQHPAETRLLALVTGLASEAGKVAGKMSKHLRGDSVYADEVDFANAMIAGLGDVLWYMTRLADVIGSDIETVARMNFEKLASRNERNQIKEDGDDR